MGAVNSNRKNISIKLPKEDLIRKYKDLIKRERARKILVTLHVNHLNGQILKVRKSEKQGKEADRLIRGRFYIYQYDASERLPIQHHEPRDPDTRVENKKASGELESDHEPTLPLSDVPKNIIDGQYYLVVETITSLWTPQ